MLHKYVYQKLCSLSAIFLLVFFLSVDARAALGTLDPTFGTGGKVFNDFFGGDDDPQKMAIQPDGKIVILDGGYYRGNLGNRLVRYNPNGTLDTNFGINGAVIIPTQPPLFEQYTVGLAISSDGRILVSGCVNNCAAFAVFRLNGNGSRDASFGANGVGVASFRSINDLYDIGSTLRVQPDGKIVVVGTLNSNCDVDGCRKDGIGAARFNADGTLDTTFGNGGKLIIPPTTAFFYGVGDLAVLPDGKLLIIGVRDDPANNRPNVFLSRINANGTLDVSFGTNGILLPQTDPSYDISKLAIQPDGKIVFAAFSADIAPTYSTIVRLNADGSFDASFGANGKVVIPNTEGLFYSSILIQSNGKILAGGGALTGGEIPFRFAITRLNANGTRDGSFGFNGTITTLMASYGGIVTDMALQPDGKLVACGSVQVNNDYSNSGIGLARYLLDTPPPTNFDFDGDGKSDISVFRPSDRIWYLNQSTAGFFAAQFGLSTDKITPADFDGDGKTDIAVYRPSEGIWYLLQSLSGFKAVRFGGSTDIPAAGDFDGDGKADLAVFRPETGVWYFLYSLNNSFAAFQFGLNGDLPVVGDYDGDSKTDAAVFRPASGVWYLQRSSLGFTAIQFGLGTDKLAPGDFDGDGKTDVAVYRPAEGNWYLQRSTAGFGVVNYGISEDIPAVGDFDGDGKTDIAVYRGGTWYILQSSNGQFTAQQFGLPDDQPVPTAFLP